METYPVTVLCRVMEVSTSVFYAECKQPEYAEKAKQKQHLENKASQIFIENKQCYGSRRLSDQLKKQGFAVGRYKTRLVMRQLKLKVHYPKRYKSTTDSNHNEAILPNRLDRQFNVAQPNQVWATASPNLDTAARLVFGCGDRLVCPARGVGWAIDDHMRTLLCVRALHMAFWQRKPDKEVCYIIPIAAASMPARHIGSIWP